MDKQAFTIKNLNVNTISGRISGSVWKRKLYKHGGAFNELCGCGYDGEAAKKIKDLLPGDKILATDYKSETITTDNGSYERVIIYDFEIVHQRGKRGEENGNYECRKSAPDTKA